MQDPHAALLTVLLEELRVIKQAGTSRLKSRAKHCTDNSNTVFSLLWYCCQAPARPSSTLKLGELPSDAAGQDPGNRAYKHFPERILEWECLFSGIWTDIVSSSHECW